MKKRYIFMAMAISFSILCGTASAQNLMLNGDLEAWDNSTTPTNWSKAENVTQISDPVYGGSYSAGHTSSPDGTQDFQQNVSGIVGGANYTISYYYLDNDPAAKTRIWSYWLNGTSTLDPNGEELRPSTYSEDNPDWQMFTVALAAPANADGFRFEVRVYHQENITGGMVYYDDFSVMSEGVSPEPSEYPTDFMATAAGLAINLDWTDATGAQLPSAYLILASTEDNIVAPVDGIAIADDLDLSDGSGAANVGMGTEAFSFGNLDVTTPYFFKIYPYTNGAADIDYKNDGTAPSATASTANVSIIEAENFNDGWGEWQQVNVLGDQVWIIDPEYGIGGTPCAKCTGYDGQAYANEDWLISPALNLDGYTSEVLSFYTADAYDGEPLEAFVSNDYDGSDPTTANWTTLEFTTSTGFFEWISSGDIDLSGISGADVYVGFRFTSTNQESATWEVDDILITGVELTGLNEENNFTAEISMFPNPAVNTVNISSNEQLSYRVYSLLGNAVTESVVFKGNANIDLSGMNSGIYLVHFSDNNGNMKIEKLVINK